MYLLLQSRTCSVAHQQFCTGPDGATTGAGCSCGQGAPSLLRQIEFSQIGFSSVHGSVYLVVKGIMCLFMSESLIVCAWYVGSVKGEEVEQGKGLWCLLRVSNPSEACRLVSGEW